VSKGIHSVKLTTAVEVSEGVKQAITKKIKSLTHIEHIELNAEVREDIIGGFILELDDQLIDASIAYDLNNVKQQFQRNDFVYKLR
jgi:F-type H+-transporting ATPase subunit delta